MEKKHLNTFLQVLFIFKLISDFVCTGICRSQVYVHICACTVIHIHMRRKGTRGRLGNLPRELSNPIFPPELQTLFGNLISSEGVKGLSRLLLLFLTVCMLWDSVACFGPHHTHQFPSVLRLTKKNEMHWGPFQISPGRPPYLLMGLEAGVLSIPSVQEKLKGTK